MQIPLTECSLSKLKISIAKMSPTSIPEQLNIIMSASVCYYLADLVAMTLGHMMGRSVSCLCGMHGVI